MPDQELNLLLDQNVPIAVADWLRVQRPKWTVHFLCKCHPLNGRTV
jgi:hypothetical protein